MGMMINGNEDHVVGMSMSMRTCIRQKLCIKMHVMLFHLLPINAHTDMSFGSVNPHSADDLSFIPSSLILTLLIS